MLRRRARKSLERWEVALVKAMLRSGSYSNQDILAYLTRPTRSVNHRAIGEIKRDEKFKAVRAASEGELAEFLSNWPDVDPQTGLSLRGDELLIKAREAMIAAVHTFNGAGLTFRSELFIVTAVIAWTYLLHAFFRREGIDYRYKDSNGKVRLTKQNAEMFWELGKCLRASECPLGKSAVDNLEFLLELRHEIEHRSTSRIDDAVSAKLQACCLNFNRSISELFGPQHGLERRLPLALQFGTFSLDQRTLLKHANTLPRNIEAMVDAFHEKMKPDELANPAFAYRVVFIPKLANRVTASDQAIEFVRPDSDEGREITRVLIRDVDRKRYAPKQIVDLMKAEGFPLFTQAKHTKLWQSMTAKDPKKGLGKSGLYKGSWEWFEPWVVQVREHCRANVALYGAKPRDAAAGAAL